ncbi:50S ribosomal protein L10 [Candidatus Pacearchaeota archaeon CG1_02_32_132]|nr:MAG: 50S ribosomal protein L10 [Candidatus Pacearchaeota archaeon CG1_02_32_132]
MKAEQKYVRDKNVPEGKVTLVKELAEKFKNSKTVLIASMKGLPGSQFNEIKKKFRGKAEVVFAKKSIIFRAIDKSEKGMLQEFKKQISSDFVLFFSKFDAFELSGMLSDNVSPSKAKAGDIAPEDIEIEPGLTELIPGPAISELSGVGLKVAVKDGKLEIIKGATVAKEGQPISDKVAGVLGKLGIEPMKVGFIPVAAYDSEEDKVYVGIKIDKIGVFEELKNLVRKALGFAIKVEYPTDKTISYFISKAAREEKALGNLMGNKEESKEEVEEKPAEEAKEEITETQNPEEKKDE